MPSASAIESTRAWFRAPTRWVVGPSLVALGAYVGLLWPQWSRNPDLSHGFFTPLIFLLLLAESRSRGTSRWLAPGLALSWATAGALFVATALFAMAGLLAASVAWSHALVLFVLATALAALLFAALLCLADDRVRLLPFNWISLTAIGLWMLSAPLPQGTYARLTLALQAHVTRGVLHSLHFLGVPARQMGNIIELATTSVGVEEACSGIRSLLSCLYAGFFFAAWQVRHPVARATLVLLAPLLAIAMNFIRSLALTLLANGGVEITGFWHDATGYAVLGATALILASLAMALSPRELLEPAATTPGSTPTASSRWFALSGAGIALLAAVFAFYGRPGPSGVTSAIDVASLLPREAEGWRVESAKDLYRFASVLQTTQLTERYYLKNIHGQPVLLDVYIAHWPAGQAPVSAVAQHTPDACWPGAGWQPEANPQPQISLSLAGAKLPTAEQRLFRSASAPPQYVWFWHIYDGRTINYRDPYSVPALLELAVRYGFRREGEQYFIRVSSNAPWPLLATEPLVQEIFANLARTGLHP